tara:strand:- start:734 stop:1492 length:759 start_codon:yes stop_codon:yes gene_type:complete
MSELAEFLEEQPLEAPPEEVAPEEVPTGETEPEVETPPEAEQPTELEGSPPEPESSESDKSVPIAALLDERDKRQAMSKELEALRKQLDERTEPEAVPDVIDDQEGFVSSIRSEVQREVFSVRAEVSQEMMRTMHDDYDAVEAKFLEMATDNPELADGMASATLPAKFAYETVKKAEKLAQMENVDEYESKTRAEIEAKVRAEIEAEVRAGIKAESDKASSLTPSIAAVTADGGNTVPPVKIENPLETTFNR